MITSKIKNFAIAFVLMTGLSCTKKNENIIVEKPKTVEAPVAKQDSTTILEAKKKAAILEISKLPKPYNDEEDASLKIAEAVKLAKAEHKNVMIQAGGNWCIWCLRFNNYVQTTPELKEMVDKNYVYYHLNYSPENKNEKVFAKYGDPGKKFGYPVFIVLNSEGKQIHIQDSSILEDGKGYGIEKVKNFFSKWAPKK